MCRLTGLRLLNGRSGSDNMWESLHVLSMHTVDYVLCKQDFMDVFNSLHINLPNIISDHCAIQFSLNYLSDNNISNINIEEEFNDQTQDCVFFCYKWDNSKTDIFIISISNVNVQSELDSLATHLEEFETNHELDNKVIL